MIDLSKIDKKRILVIGDVMLDTYYTGDVKRISPEAPVPVFRKRSEQSVLGGAANVAANLVAADQNVSIVTVIGNDEAGRKLKGKLDEKGIDTDFALVLDRNTTVKTRFLASNNQQVIRLDIEDTDEINAESCDCLFEKIEKNIEDFDLILLSDYLKGFLTYNFTQNILQLAKDKGIPAIVDVKDPKVDKYKDAFLLKPNLKELRELTGLPASNEDEILAASKELRKVCNVKYVLTTCGSGGMVLVGGEPEQPFFIDAVGQEVFDVTGAGDTTIAYLAACMANGLEMRDCVEVANFAAGIQVGKVGTSSVYWTEIRERLADQKEEVTHKILDSSALKSFRKNHKDKKIVFTNGCFDILHIGHVRYMQEAAKLGDILVVGLNSDASVKRLKGPERPVNSEMDRAELLCALGFVDYVVIFDEDTPYNLISEVQPDVLVKGGDYQPDDVVGKELVEARGGVLVLIPFVPGKSTTKIIEKIQK